jgi:serine/threonine-protein kinase RsbW
MTMSGTVTLTFPAQTQNVSLARTVTAAMAVRADLPLDQLEDARLAVDEAVSQVIADAPAGAQVTCEFTVLGNELGIIVRAPSASGVVPPTGTFSWTVLTALVDDVTAAVEDGVVVLGMRVVRAVAVDV